MGSTTSKATRAAAPTARKYPSRIPPTAPPSHLSPNQPPAASGPGPTVHPSPSASSTKTPAITSDASDPDFAASLRSLGPVTPNSTLSNSSTFSPRTGEGLKNVFPDPAMNPAVRVLAARERLAGEAEREFARVRGYTDDVDGGGGAGGRRFLDVFTLRRVLVMRDEKGMGAGEIERAIGLAEGVVGRLGERGVVGEVSMGGGS